MPINNFRNITTIGFDEDGLTTTTIGDRVRNFAVVTTTGDLANGIYAGADDVLVYNFGTIETIGTGAEGVLIEGAGAQVRNLGSIVTHGDPTDDFLHFNDAISVVGDDFDVQSWGRLETEGFAASGVFAFGNGGLIRNFGSISTSGEFSDAILASGDGALIHNFGSISTSGDSANAISAFGDDFHVDNWGALATEGGVRSRGIFALGNDGLIRNFGSIGTSGFLSQGLLAGGDNNRIENFGTIRIDDPSGLTPAMDATGSHNEVVNFGTITGHMFAGAAQILSGVGNTATNWGIISTDDLDRAIGVTGRDALARNFGTIEAVGGGLGAFGDAGAQVHNAGPITTHGDLGDGLFANTGAGGNATNAGSIRTDGDGAAGITFLSSLGGEVTNSGSIETFGALSGGTTAGGVNAFGLDVLVRNTRTGSIETHDPNSPAVSLNVHDVASQNFRPGIIAADTHARLENEGVISAAQTAVLGGAGDETVINHGRIVGNVSLGGGDDTYVAARSGELRGEILTGEGDDTIVFHDGSGQTRVVDFEPGAGSEDILDLSAFGFDTFGDVLDATHQDGADLIIRLDGNDLALLSNVSLSSLHMDDFLLMA